MMSQFVLLLVLVTVFSNVESFVGRSSRVQAAATTFKHSPLLMSKASQEKADEKKRKQAMVWIPLQ